MLNNLVEQYSSKIFRRENCYIYIGHLGREQGAMVRIWRTKIDTKEEVSCILIGKKMRIIEMEHEYC